MPLATYPAAAPASCYSCGYDLQGLAPPGPCPECGEPFAASSAVDILQNAPADWLWLLRIGAVLAMAALSARAATDLVGSWKMVTGRALPWSAAVRPVFGWVTMIGAFAGVWLLTIKRPRLRIDRDAALRTVTRTVAIVWVLLNLALFRLHLLLGAPRAYARLIDSPTDGVFVVLFWLWIRRLSMRFRLPKIGGRALLIACIAGAAMLVVTLVGVALELHWYLPKVTINVLSAMAFLDLLADLWGPLVLLEFWSALSELSRMQPTPPPAAST